MCEIPTPLGIVLQILFEHVMIPELDYGQYSSLALSSCLWNSNTFLGLVLKVVMILVLEWVNILHYLACQPIVLVQSNLCDSLTVSGGSPQTILMANGVRAFGYDYWVTTSRWNSFK